MNYVNNNIIIVIIYHYTIMMFYFFDWICWTWNDSYEPPDINPQFKPDIIGLAHFGDTIGTLEWQVKDLDHRSDVNQS